MSEKGFKFPKLWGKPKQEVAPQPVDPVEDSAKKAESFEDSINTQKANIHALQLQLANSELELLNTELDKLTAQKDREHQFGAALNAETERALRSIVGMLLKIKERYGVKGDSEDPSQMVAEIRIRSEEVKVAEAGVDKLLATQRAAIAAKETAIARLTSAPIIEAREQEASVAAE